MTVKLLSAWGAQPVNTLYTESVATEAAMVANKVATTDLTDAFTWVPPGNAQPAGLTDLKRAEIEAVINAAAADNPLTRQTWTVPPPYVPGTTYNRGASVCGIGAGNTSNMYHCTFNGLAAAGAGPVGTASAEITDGGVSWIYVGKVNAIGSRPLLSSVVPAVATDEMNGYLAYPLTTNRAALGLTKLWRLSFPDTVGRLLGGPVVPGPGGSPAMVGSPAGAVSALITSRAANNRTCFHFLTNARRWLWINSNSITAPSRALQIEINGRALIDYGICPASVVGVGMLLDMSTFGAGTKDIKIYGFGPCPELFHEIYTSPEDLIWKPVGANKLKLCFEGDSITQNGGSDSGPAREQQEILTAHLLGFDNYYNNSVGASGCIQTNVGTRTNYPQRIQFLAEEKPDILVVGGFHNDVNFPSLERRAAFLDYFIRLRAAMPACTIFILGTHCLQNESMTTLVEPSLLQTERDSKIAFDLWADKNSSFIPLLTDTPAFPGVTTAGWFYCDPQGRGANGHPVTRYHRAVAEKVAQGVRQFFS